MNPTTLPPATPVATTIAQQMEAMTTHTGLLQSRCVGLSRLAVMDPAVVAAARTTTALWAARRSAFRTESTSNATETNI